MGHVVTDKPNNNGVPQNCGWARKRVEQLPCKVGLAFLAEFAKARANGEDFGSVTRKKGA